MDSSKIADYYDKYGKLYHENRIKKGQLFNEFIERPIIESLILNQQVGKNVLDIGCGSGIYTKLLSENNFKVTAIDASREMIKIARVFNSQNDANFINTSFEDFTTDIKFDLILGSFSLGYFEDLESIFTKINSMLNHEGKVILSSIHPVRMSAKKRSFKGYIIDNYFDTNTYDTIIVKGKPSLSIFKHTIQDVIEAAFKSGFYTERIIEPKPTKDFEQHSKFSFFFKCPSVIIFQFSKK